MGQEAIGMYCAQSLQMNDNKDKYLGIRHFVREHLGCVCPDEVFDKVTVTEQSRIFSARHTAYEIGGRLFVAVFEPENWQGIALQLDRLVVDGKRFRDQHGYNRLRLVIASDDDGAEKELQRIFNDLPDIDEKTHLHVIKPDCLP
jgi:hypothetical protein